MFARQEKQEKTRQKDNTASQGVRLTRLEYMQLMQQRQNSLDDKEDGEEPLGMGSSPLPKRQLPSKRASSLDPHAMANTHAE